MNQAEVLQQLSQMIEQAKEGEDRPSGVTCRELSRAMGISRGRIGEKLRDLVEDGLIEVTKGKQVSPITGFAIRTYFYSPSSASAENGKD